MNLIIDIGNTRTKYTVFDGKTETYSLAEDEFTHSSVEFLKKDFPHLNKCILSASGHIPKGTPEFLKTNFLYALNFTQSVSLPFKSNYQTIETIGLDRLAGVAGANEIYPNNNVLIIDMGTAITYDLKNMQNVHLGGNISPGMSMRFKALNTFTDKLPLVKPGDCSNLFGLSTIEAIESGVINGIVSELEGIIKAFENNYNNLTIIVTGGDAQFFVNKLKKTIFVVQNLVSTGLNSILLHNAEKN